MPTPGVYTLTEYIDDVVTLQEYTTTTYCPEPTTFVQASVTYVVSDSGVFSYVLTPDAASSSTMVMTSQSTITLAAPVTSSSSELYTSSTTSLPKFNTSYERNGTTTLAASSIPSNSTSVAIQPTPVVAPMLQILTSQKSAQSSMVPAAAPIESTRKTRLSRVRATTLPLATLTPLSSIISNIVLEVGSTASVINMTSQTITVPTPISESERISADTTATISSVIPMMGTEVNTSTDYATFLSTATTTLWSAIPVYETTTIELSSTTVTYDATTLTISTPTLLAVAVPISTMMQSTMTSTVYTTVLPMSSTLGVNAQAASPTPLPTAGGLVCDSDAIVLATQFCNGIGLAAVTSYVTIYSSAIAS